MFLMKEIVDNIVSYVGSSRGDYALYNSIKSVYNRLDNTDRIDCLKQSQRSIIRFSEDNIIDRNLPKFVRLFSTLSTEYSEVDILLERYVIFNMNNYERLDVDKRTTERFRVIFDTCMYLKDFRLLKKILGDGVFWLKEWGLSGDDIAEDGECNTDEKYKVIKTSVKHSNRKTELYILISNIKQSLFDNYIINNRLQHLITIINTHLSSSEARELYEERGEVLHLFKTKDIEFIEKEFNEKSINVINAPYVDLNRISEILHSLVDKRALLFFYLHIAPQYPITSIDTSIFLDDIKTYPSILDEIIKNEYWISNQVSLTTWLKLLPEEYWTDAYRFFLKEQFEIMFVDKYAIEPFNIFEKNGSFYIGLKNATLKKWRNDYYHAEYSLCPTAMVTEMRLEHLNKALADILRKEKEIITIWEKCLPDIIVIESDFDNDVWHFIVVHDTKTTFRSLVELKGELYKKVSKNEHVCIKLNYPIKSGIYIYPKNRERYYTKIRNYQKYFTEEETKKILEDLNR